MKKIPTVFLRDWDGTPKYVTKEPNPDCAWVFDGEGVATRKYDGTCVAYLALDEAGGTPGWYARREVKPGKTAPDGFRPLSTDEETGKTIGWEPVEQSAFARWHTEALDGMEPQIGTYELVGPKVNGNPERQDRHRLVRHAEAEVLDVRDLTYDGVRAIVTRLAEQYGCEGIVWHHADGRRMAKIKARDFPSTP
ncbi:hypothetical protein [Microtetraspora malaysiensis]|uniref:hypothetical protein n=1 Tax=Microtetraspora malaysiensis TaxID=161358 RepID=UPI003D8C4731